MWSHHRSSDADWERGKPFLRCNSELKTMTTRTPRCELPNMAIWQYVLPMSVPRAPLPSLTKHALGLFGGTKIDQRMWKQSRTSVVAIAIENLCLPGNHTSRPELCQFPQSKKGKCNPRDNRSGVEHPTIARFRPEIATEHR